MKFFKWSRGDDVADTKKDYIGKETKTKTSLKKVNTSIDACVDNANHSTRSNESTATSLTMSTTADETSTCHYFKNVTSKSSKVNEANTQQASIKGVQDAIDPEGDMQYLHNRCKDSPITQAYEDFFAVGIDISNKGDKGGEFEEDEMSNSSANTQDILQLKALLDSESRIEESVEVMNASIDSSKPDSLRVGKSQDSHLFKQVLQGIQKHQDANKAKHDQRISSLRSIETVGVVPTETKHDRKLKEKTPTAGNSSPSNSTTSVSKSKPSLLDMLTLNPKECVESYEKVKEKLIKDLGLVELEFKKGEPRSILINKELKVYKTFKSVENNYKRFDQYFIGEEDLRETLEDKGWVGPWESKDKVKHWSDICSKICLLEGLDYQAANCRGAYPDLTVRKECQGLRFQQLKKNFKQGSDFFHDTDDLQKFAYDKYNWTGPDGYRPVQEGQKRTRKPICDLNAIEKEQKEGIKNYANLKTYSKEKKEKDKKRKKSNLDDDGRNRNAKVSKTTTDAKTVKTSKAVSAHSRKCPARSAAQKKAKTTARKKSSLSKKSINCALPKRRVKGGSGSKTKTTSGTKTSTAKLNDKEMDVEYNLPVKESKCLDLFLKQKEEAIEKIGKSKDKDLHDHFLNCLEKACKRMNKFNQDLVQLVTNVEVGEKIVEIFQKQQDETGKMLEKYCDDEKLKDVLMKHLEKILESIDSANEAVLK